MANTYGLYQKKFQGIKEIIAYYELGLKEEALDLIHSTLEDDRATFDRDGFTVEVVQTIRRIGRLRGLDKEELDEIIQKYLLAN